MDTSYGPLVVKPSAATYGKYVKQGLPLIGVLAAVLIWNAFRTNDSTAGRVGVLVMLVVVVVIAGVTMWSYLKGASVTVSPHEVDAVGFLWHHRRFPRTDVAYALEVGGLSQPSSMRPPVAMLVLLDASGNRLLRLNGAMWDTAAMDAIAQATGAPVEPPGVVSAKELQARHPHAVTPLEVHPVLFGLLIALGVIVAIVAGVLIYASATGSF